MAFTVFDIEAEVAELQGARRRLRGVRDAEDRRTASRPMPAGRAAWFKDPHGNLLGLIQFDDPT